MYFYRKQNSVQYYHHCIQYLHVIFHKSMTLMLCSQPSNIQLISNVSKSCFNSSLILTRVGNSASFVFQIDSTVLMISSLKLHCIDTYCSKKIQWCPQKITSCTKSSNIPRTQKDQADGHKIAAHQHYALIMRKRQNRQKQN